MRSLNSAFQSEELGFVSDATLVFDMMIISIVQINGFLATEQAAERFRGSVGC